MKIHLLIMMKIIMVLILMISKFLIEKKTKKFEDIDFKLLFTKLIRIL